MQFLLKTNLTNYGLAHLLGHDHKKEKDYKKMIRVEKEFLRYVN